MLIANWVSVVVMTFVYAKLVKLAAGCSSRCSPGVTFAAVLNGASVRLN